MLKFSCFFNMTWVTCKESQFCIHLYTPIIWHTGRMKREANFISEDQIEVMLIENLERRLKNRTLNGDCFVVPPRNDYCFMV